MLTQDLSKIRTVNLPPLFRICTVQSCFLGFNCDTKTIKKILCELCLKIVLGIALSFLHPAVLIKLNVVCHW